MRCEWCRQRIALLDAQTSDSRTHWHTGCWNEVERERQQYFEEMDNPEGFAPRIAPPDASRPALLEELGPKPQWSEVIYDMATATPTNNRPPRDVVEFPSNVPVTVALKYPQGRTFSGQYGERVMFTLVDGRVMFLAPEVAGKIESLGINVRESFTITKCPTGHKDTPVTWNIERVPGEQPNGTLVVPPPNQRRCGNSPNAGTGRHSRQRNGPPQATGQRAGG